MLCLSGFELYSRWVPLLILEELKKKSPPGFKEFEVALGSQGLDDEHRLSCGRIFSNTEKFLNIVWYLYYSQSLNFPVTINQEKLSYWL